MKCVLILAIVALLSVGSDAIINGQNSFIRNAPYICSIHMFRRHKCGCVIVNKNHVLTTGHCVTMTGGDVYTVVAGTTMISSMFEPNAQIRKVRKVTLHKEYNPRLLRNDIAVVQTVTPFTWTPTCQPAKLLEPNRVVAPSTPVYTWGWGLTEESKNGFGFALQNRLREAKMATTKNEDCTAAYSGRFMPPEVTCISTFLTKQDACQGDNGGPVALVEGESPAERPVYCLITWALGCNRGYPRVCINIGHYREWIDSIVNAAPATIADDFDTLNFNEHSFAMMNISEPQATPIETLSMPVNPEASLDAQSNTRIVGGEHTNINDAPWLVNVRLFHTQICGGTIITPNHVITAAHCMCYPGNGIYTVMAGSSLRSGSLMDMRVVGRITSHPDYNPRTLRGDISILQTRTSISVNHRTIAIARLPPAGICEQLPIGQMGLIAGWGMTKENNGDSLSHVLQATRIPLVANKVCQDRYGGRFVPPSVICAGNSFGVNDACQGDTGGPFVINNMLFGSISWSFGCGRPTFPRVLVCISHYRQWIDSVINK